MGKKNYQIESDFDDLHGNPDDSLPELDVDLSDTDNPIIKAALQKSDENWKPPEDEDKDDDKPFKDDDEDDDDELEELDSDEDQDEDEDEDEDEDADEADEDEDSDEDEDEDEDDDKYSKNVRKRIERERRLRKQDRADADARFAKLERENKLIRKEGAFNITKAEAESELKSLRQAKIDAKEEGDTAKEVDIDEKILDVKSKVRTAETELKQAKDEVDSGTSDTDGTPPAGLKWLKKYPQFHTNQQFKRVVLSADSMVSDRGFDRNTDEYYEEIEKICAVQFPEIVKPAKKSTRKGKRTETANKKRRRSAVGGTSKAGARKARKTRSGQIRLTKADQDQMVVFGMDPKNPEHIREWASNKSGS